MKKNTNAWLILKVLSQTDITLEFSAFVYIGYNGQKSILNIVWNKKTFIKENVKLFDSKPLITIQYKASESLESI